MQEVLTFHVLTCTFKETDESSYRIDFQAKNRIGSQHAIRLHVRIGIQARFASEFRRSPSMSAGAQALIIKGFEDPSKAAPRFLKSCCGFALLHCC